GFSGSGAGGGVGRCGTCGCGGCGGCGGAAASPPIARGLPQVEAGLSGSSGASAGSGCAAGGCGVHASCFAGVGLKPAAAGSVPITHCTFSSRRACSDTTFATTELFD